MSIAVLGAGFAGLAVTWFLLNHKQKVTLFDPKGIGGGASFMAAGLLHPYAGEDCKRSWRATLGLEDTLSLIDVAEKALDKKVADRSGIVRLILNETQKRAFESHLHAFCDVELWDEERIKAILPGIIATSAAFVKTGITVNCKDYLEGLWQACSKLGVSLILEKIDDLASLDEFDQIVLTSGSSIFYDETLVKKIKGQLIQFIPRQPLPFSVIGKGYLARVPETAEWIAGSTYEKDYTSEEPSPSIAFSEISRKVVPFFPDFLQSEILEYRAGIRVGRKNHYLPLVRKLRDNLWTLTALQSRGLLYHAHLAEMLSLAIVKNDETLLPQEIR